jgi:PKD repeat protein
VSQQEDINVTVTTIPTTTITPDQNICFGDSIVITASGGNSYSWNTGDTTASITVGASTPPATYTVVISKDACADFDTASTTVITIQKPTADFIASDTLAELQNATISFTNSSSSALAFDWNLGDGNTSTSTNPVHTYLDTGWYTVTLVALNDDCPSDTLELTNYIHIVQDTMTGGISLEQVIGFTVYPNPFSSNIHIRTYLHDEFTIALSDLLGKNLYELADVQLHEGEVLHLDLARLNLSSGVYLLSVSSHNTKKFSRIIKD